MATDGYCHLCGQFGPLTFEHIPPRRCLNKSAVRVVMIESVLLGDKIKKHPSKLARNFRAGMGADTLCASCNGKTGEWYGDAFAVYTQQALRYCDKVPGGNRVMLPFELEPLEVIKQILVTSIAASNFTPNCHRWLRNFINVPSAFGSIHPYRVYAYLNASPDVRWCEAASVLGTTEGILGLILSEVSMRPLGHVVRVTQQGDGGLESRGLHDVSHWSEYPPRTRRTLYPQLQVLRPANPLPLQYSPP